MLELSGVLHLSRSLLSAWHCYAVSKHMIVSSKGPIRCTYILRTFLVMCFGSYVIHVIPPYLHNVNGLQLFVVNLDHMVQAILTDHLSLPSSSIKRNNHFHQSNHLTVRNTSPKNGVQHWPTCVWFLDIHFS